MYGYYGQQSDEQSKEGNFAPWELVRVAKAGESADWILINREYKRFEPSKVVVGN